MIRLIEAKSYEEMSLKAARVIASQVILKPDCVLGLATGSSPVGLYGILADWYEKGELDFSAVCSVNLDEYCGLDGSNDQSYRYFMNTNLFDKININKELTHVPDGMAVDFDAECKRYDGLIGSLGGIDMQLLGLGPNGHIGFNEPNDAFSTGTHVVSLDESTVKANARFFENEDMVPKKAITTGMREIMQARKILLIVNTPSKAGILKIALEGHVTPRVPASILQLHPDVTVIAVTE